MLVIPPESVMPTPPQLNDINVYAIFVMVAPPVATVIVNSPNPAVAFQSPAFG
jgi:hypothetical protein